MGERLFLRRNGIITGPFPEEQLRGMFSRNELAPEAELSPDKTAWLSARRCFTEELLPEELPEPVSEAPEEIPESEDAEETPPDAEFPASIQPQTAATSENFWKTVPCKVISLLWNAPGALERLWADCGKHQVQSGFLALALAAFLCAFANALFAGHYPLNPMYLWLMSLAFLPGAFLLSWGVLAAFGGVKRRGGEHHAAGDVVAAGALALECAGFHVIAMALLFLLNAEWSPTRLKLALPFFILLLFGANFALNGFAAMRRRLMAENGFSACPASAIALIWNVILQFAYIEGIMLPVILSTGVLQ